MLLPGCVWKSGAATGFFLSFVFFFSCCGIGFRRCFCAKKLRKKASCRLRLCAPVGQPARRSLLFAGLHVPTTRVPGAAVPLALWAFGKRACCPRTGMFLLERYEVFTGPPCSLWVPSKLGLLCFFYSRDVFDSHVPTTHVCSRTRCCCCG